MNTESIWNNIKRYEGEIFSTITGKSYSYSVHGDYLIVNGINGGKIKKDSFEKAIRIADPTPKKIESAGCWGTSYVYGIVTDKRIREF